MLSPSWVTSSRILTGATAVLAMLSSSPAFAWRASLPTDWNRVPAPTALYGGCLSGSSGLGSKPSHLDQAGLTLQDVLAVTVLRCEPYGSFGTDGSKAVACPGGSPYASCIENGNDGLGNAVLFGVLKRNPTTSAYAQACAGGPTKVDLLIRAGQDPRLINGIVTIACQPASGATGVGKVKCAAGPSPYAYCLRSKNDGSGHDVTLGVVAANGPGDPYGLYGECHAATSQGFLPKIQLVEKTGGAPDKVQGIDLIVCNEPIGLGGGFPTTLQKVDCALSPYFTPGIASRYDYCIVGTDSKRNGIVAGVMTTK